VMGQFTLHHNLFLFSFKPQFIDRKILTSEISISNSLSDEIGLSTNM
jgi:hypothetical protein